MNTKLKHKRIIRKSKKQNKGITLIALVITIIVLLILAGVTIATLTGDNGILTQANNAKKKTTEAETIERVKAEVTGSYGTEGTIEVEQLNENLRKNIKGLTYNGKAITEKGATDENRIESLPATVTLSGYDIVINGNGSVSKKITLAEAKANGTVFGNNTTITDTYGNSVKIPAGFKIASDSADDVTGGIVIEDATYTKTIGSQFVWIPVGTGENAIKKADKTTVEIALSRYTFASDGTPTAQGEKEIDSGYQELSTSKYGEAVAKDIEDFKTKATNNHGYWFGRYEAGVTGYTLTSTNNSNSETNWTGYTGENIKLVCKPGEQVWNYVTQNKASGLSRNMYTSNDFTSDLINSYAWDTAIVFIQTFGTESNSKAYSRQNGISTNTSAPSTTGTGMLWDTSKEDKQCNIYDMAGNCWEWTTETYNSFHSSYVPSGVIRGSNYARSDIFTSYRDGHSLGTYSDVYSFRPLLYL